MAQELSDDERPAARFIPLARRGFLGILGIGGAGIAIASCEVDDHHVSAPGPVDRPEILPEDAAPTGTGTGVLRFLNPHEGSTVEAITGRLIPGTEDNPGAREAGAVFYIDNLLASHPGYARPTYTAGPYAQTYTSGAPPEDEAAVVWVQEDQLDRYGWQSAFLPREIYRSGLARLDALSRRRFGNDYVDLSEQRQDEVLAAVEDGEDDVTETFGDLPPGDFFQMVRSHTLQGFLADPVYGGNRDAVGWRLIGFPGSRRSYSPQALLDENFDVTPQSLLSLTPFNNDRSAHHDDVSVAVRSRPPNAPVD